MSYEKLLLNLKKPHREQKSEAQADSVDANGREEEYLKTENHEIQELSQLEQELKSVLDEIEELRRRESGRILESFSTLVINKKNYKFVKTVLKQVFGKKHADKYLSELLKIKEAKHQMREAKSIGSFDQHNPALEVTRKNIDQVSFQGNIREKLGKLSTDFKASQERFEEYESSENVNYKYSFNYNYLPDLRNTHVRNTYYRSMAKSIS